MSNDKMFIFLKNVAKDYELLSNGSDIESAIDTDATDETILASMMFSKQVEDILAEIEEADSKTVQQIQESALLMAREYEKSAFQKGFEYALKLTEVI